MIARFPRAKAAGYNGVVFSHNVAASKAGELKEAARQHGLDLIVTVMANPKDRNYTEGVLVTNALFQVRERHASVQQDNPTRVLNGDFEDVKGDHFKSWGFQDDEGVTTFADNQVVHGGKVSLRMENISQNPNHVCRLSQVIKLQPHRQYAISFWIKTEALSPADPEVKVLTPDAKQGISFQSFRVQATQDWKEYHVVFNSFANGEGRIYIGTWSGNHGKIWWDDLRIEEIGLVNVLRRPGCPVFVRGEDGTNYEEGRDYQREHKVYDREGQTCRRCRSTIIKVKVNGRSSFLCPQCQV